MSATVTPFMLLMARANVARRMVREGQIDGPLALFYTVWPTVDMQEAEEQVNSSTLNSRAFSAVHNK